MPNSGARPGRPLGCVEYAAVTASVLLPNALTLVCFSPVGDLTLGLEIYDAVADSSQYGDFVLCGAALVFVVYFIFDWADWWPCLKGVSLILPWILFSVGCVLKGRKYPWAPMLWAISHVAFLLGPLRVFVCKDVWHTHFYYVILLTSLAIAVFTLALWWFWLAEGNLWNSDTEARLAAEVPKVFAAFNIVCAGVEGDLNYQLHCGARKNELGLVLCSALERSSISEDCSKATTVVFMFWACPVIVCSVNFIISIFVFVNGMHLKSKRGHEQSIVKQFILGLAAVGACMYAAAMSSGASVQMGGTLMAFFVAGLVFLMGWLAAELGNEALTKLEHQASPILDRVMSMGGDWLRALMMGTLMLFGPVFLCIDMLRQCVRRSKGKYDVHTHEYEDRFTHGTRFILDHVREWSWAGVMIKICILGELFFSLQVLFAKGVYIFLSVLDTRLTELMEGVAGMAKFSIICALVFVIGWIMFLIPVVPGIPVYLFSGIVIAQQGQDEPGFAVACIVAVALAFVNKLWACACQYGIGRALGGSTKIQQLIGVDKPGTRALEKILRKQGLDAGKVGILVGGPDWPISVTCGILRCQIGQMLIGTLPVFFVVGPIVLAGAFMSQVQAGQESIESQLAQIFTLVSSAVVAASGLIAVYYTMEVLEKYHDELIKHRPEHEKVEELSRRDAEYAVCYTEATRWGSLNPVWKAWVIAMSYFMLISCGMLCFLGEQCFRSFSISSKIEQSYQDFGLTDEDGNTSALNIVRPFGWYPLILFGLAACMHIFFGKAMGCRAKAAFNKDAAGKPATKAEGLPATGEAQEADAAVSPSGSTKG